MRKIKVVVLLVRQLQHGFIKNAKVSPNLTVTHKGKGSEFLTTLISVTEIRTSYKQSNIIAHSDWDFAGRDGLS